MTELHTSTSLDKGLLIAITFRSPLIYSRVFFYLEIPELFREVSECRWRTAPLPTESLAELFVGYTRETEMHTVVSLVWNRSLEQTYLCDQEQARGCTLHCT